MRGAPWCGVVLAAGTWLAAGPVTAQAPLADSAREATGMPGRAVPRSRVPLALAAAAVIALPLDAAITRSVRTSDFQDPGLSDAASGLRAAGVPGTLVVGGSLYLAGVLGESPRTAALGLRALEAIAASEAIVVVGKAVAGRVRPFADPDRPLDLRLGRGLRGDRYHSFPSGHTAVAFALATAVSAEGRHCCPGPALRYVPPALYAAAALVGVSRVYEGDHWASDVLAGAAIGTFAGLHVVRYHRQRPGRWPDRWLLPQAAVPADGGVRLVWSLPGR